MSAPLQFILAAALLTLVALALLLSPWWRKGREARPVDRRQANLEIFRDQLQELERTRDEGLLTVEDFDQAKRELQRRLLEETDAAPAPAVAKARMSGRSALVLGLTLVLAAVFGYWQLGNPQALEPPQVRAHAQAQELDAMLNRLVERLKANPDDAKGWIMLARSYKSLGRFAEAADAYARGMSAIEGDAYLLADYAETLLQANGGNFNEKTDALVAKALKIDPNGMLALFLAGHSANERGNFRAAVDYWERLLPQLDAGGEDAEAVEAAIEKARAAAGMQGKPASKKEAAKASGGAPTKDAIEGEVVLSGKLIAKAQPEDTLYVFARPAEGSRMPLAVIRARAADLPLKFRLDDSNSLPGGQKLSMAQSVVLEARVTKGGIAQSSPGDLIGTLKSVKPGSKNQRLVIDQVQP